MEMKVLTRMIPSQRFSQGLKQHSFLSGIALVDNFESSRPTCVVRSQLCAQPLTAYWIGWREQQCSGEQFTEAQENEPPGNVEQCCQLEQPPFVSLTTAPSGNFRQRVPLCCLASLLTASQVHSQQLAVSSLSICIFSKEQYSDKGPRWPRLNYHSLHFHLFPYIFNMRSSVFVH